ncbi:hypothetical protein ACROYT_G010129, partial [Oculina patagonica]
MKEVWYGVIVGLPAFLTAYGPFIILLLMGYRVKRLRRWVATYAFSRIINTKTDDSGETRWLFKDLDLTNEAKILSRVLSSLFYLFLVLFGGIVLLFYQLLLLDVNFQCDPNEKTQDCFRQSLWDLEAIKKFSRDSVKCNSAVARNGTVEVVCYKIVFNFGLAAGASYGGFQLSMVALNVATSAMLMAKQAKTVLKIRLFLGVLSLGLLAVVIAVQATSLRNIFTSDNLVIALQGLVSVVAVYYFVFGIPWKKLIALKAVNNQPATATRLRAVPVRVRVSEEQRRQKEQQGHE